MGRNPARGRSHSKQETLTYMAQYNRRAVWHTFGEELNHAYTSQEIMARPLFNYEVEKRQLSLDGKPVDAWGTVRMDNGKFLSPVGRDYTVIPHRLGFGMMDALVGGRSSAYYETAGVAGDGQTVWALANLKMTLSVGDDKSEIYLLFSTSYDGSHSHTYRTTSLRFICSNTLSLALSRKTDAQLRFRHTRNAQTRIDHAHKVLENLGDDVRTAEEKLNFLASRSMTRESVTSIFDRLFPKTKNDDGIEHSSPRRDNILAEILSNYELNDGNAFPEQRGSAYALLNAVTAYTDHQRGTDATRAKSALFGGGEVLKNKALDIIVEQSQSLPQLVSRRTMVFAPSAVMTPTVSAPVAPTSTSLLESIAAETEPVTPSPAVATEPQPTPAVLSEGAYVKIIAGAGRLVGQVAQVFTIEGSRVGLRTSIGRVFLNADQVAVTTAVRA